MEQNLPFPRGQNSGRETLGIDAITGNSWIDNEAVLPSATGVEREVLMDM
jgi:hypothetical protein